MEEFKHTFEMNEKEKINSIKEAGNIELFDIILNNNIVEQCYVVVNNFKVMINDKLVSFIKGDFIMFKSRQLNV